MKNQTCLLSSTYFGPVQWYQKLNRYGQVLLEGHDHFVKQTYRNRCVIATTNGPQVLSIPVEKYEGAKCEMLDVRISDHGNWRHLHWNALQSAYGESPFFEYLADDIRPFFERRWDYLFDFNLEITHKMCELLQIEPRVEVTEEYESLTASPLTPLQRERGSAIPHSACQRESHSPYDLTPNPYGLTPNPSPKGEGKCHTPFGMPARKPTPPPFGGGWGEAVGLGGGCRGEAPSDFRDAIRPKHPMPDADFQPRRYYQVFEQKHGFLPNLSILDLLFNMGNEAVLYL